MIRIHIEVEIEDEQEYGLLEDEDAAALAEELVEQLKDHPSVEDAWVANLEFE